MNIPCKLHPSKANAGFLARDQGNPVARCPVHPAFADRSGPSAPSLLLCGRRAEGGGHTSCPGPSPLSGTRGGGARSLLCGETWLSPRLGAESPVPGAPRRHWRGSCGDGCTDRSRHPTGTRGAPQPHLHFTLVQGHLGYHAEMGHSRGRGGRGHPVTGTSDSVAAPGPGLCGPYFEAGLAAPSIYKVLGPPSCHSSFHSWGVVAFSLLWTFL